MPGKNPYRPGASTPPLHLAGREPQMRLFERMLRNAPEIPANLRLTGLRGVGKSVLLKELQTIAMQRDWAAVRHQLEPRHNTNESLSKLIGRLVDDEIPRLSARHRIASAAGALVAGVRRAAVMNVGDTSFSLSGETAHETDVAHHLQRAATAALEAGYHGFALMLDEAQVLRDETSRDGEHPVSMLVAAVNSLQEADVPVALILCGLPTLRANLQRARTYSERMFRGEEIGALEGNPGPARDAFTRPLEGTGVTADEDLIARVLDEVEGYPFFIQLWGAELWDTAADTGVTHLSTEMLRELEGSIYRRLDNEFYAGRLDTLTPAEQDLLLASADCPYPPLRTTDLKALSDKSGGNINVLMGRLVDQGALYRVQKATYAYTAPKFHEFLKRRQSQAKYE